MLDWFRQWVGFPREAAGVLVSGGSAANLTALACAREALIGATDDRATIYLSDQTHSSVARAVRALGFRPDQVRVISSDPQARIRLDGLRAAIAADRGAGRRPLVVVANAGSTTAVPNSPCGQRRILLGARKRDRVFEIVEHRDRRDNFGRRRSRRAIRLSGEEVRYQDNVIHGVISGRNLAPVGSMPMRFKEGVR